ncbi:hypothetical protein [Virgibacillus necropolis]|uniref:Uncharacterized protein n=1 Tax=Virgibacillus necropolis TaxID=163877 RepID=A0A221M7K5_9BACI|nr:hypothetical protein [Virgibacillus necropolis]ASN03620.1 hypothetical protein CFK40_00565 [Virgibacillus necropolis]
MQWLTKYLYSMPLFGLFGFVGFFIPSTWSLQNKIILSLVIISICYFGYGLRIQYRLYETSQTNDNLQDKVTRLRNETDSLRNKIDLRDKFIHKRQIFVTHDLKFLSDLLKEYNAHVVEKYPNKKYERLRDEAASVRKRGIDIISKEERDFDEQFYDIQSDKDN